MRENHDSHHWNLVFQVFSFKGLLWFYTFSKFDGNTGRHLSGLPLSAIAPRQRVQNAAARLVLRFSPERSQRRDHLRRALKE